MLSIFHRSITLQALGKYFTPPALEVILAANLGQDTLRGQIGHDEFHFDANAFAKSYAYLEANRDQVPPALERGDLFTAWRAMGRLTHAAQDFYAHSNYISLWLACFPSDAWPAPEEINPLDGDLLASPALRSGKLYYPLEALSYISSIKKYILPLIPRDSHAWMNLDAPGQGPKFPYAMAAAIKRTDWEYEETMRRLPENLALKFTGR
jgi:hypothetical protein